MGDIEQHVVVVASVVFDDDGRVLLMRRRDLGHWEPPGGKLKVGERLEEGARREVAEETRVGIDVESLTGIYENVSLGVLSIVFRARPSRGDAARTHEASDVRWASPEEVDDLLAPDYAVWVADAARAEGVVVRAQTGTVKGASASPVPRAGARATVAPRKAGR